MYQKIYGLKIIFKSAAPQPGEPSLNPTIYFLIRRISKLIDFCGVHYTQLGPFLILSNSAAMLLADPGWGREGKKTGGNELPVPQKRAHRQKNHTGSSNRRDALSGFERHRKLEDLVATPAW